MCFFVSYVFELIFYIINLVFILSSFKIQMMIYGMLSGVRRV